MAVKGSVEVTGLNEVKAMLKQYGDKAQEALNSAVYREAEYVLGEAKTEAPVDTGALRGSGVVTKEDDGATVVVGFGGPAAPYALRQHEEHRSKSKYLERPFLRAMKGLDTRIAAEMKKDLE